MIRLFVGLALPSDLAARLAALAGGIPGARWVAAHNLHVTLRFIGAVDEGMAEDLHHRLRAIHGPAFDLRLDGFGTFGGGKPRALWAGIAAHAELDSLQIRIEQAARDVGLAAETRKFTPHVTLAWLKAAPPERIAAFLAHHSPFVALLPVTGFTLYRSHLGGEGAEYEALAEYFLDH
ncbi:MAG: hypothetical protein FD176_1277 [Rhodospirillaceae bacterium]|nr:MAG: hypothetical protein FD176_1277 [Rhodospirillaceae bacterium]TNC94105.1 MAG: 2',5' RNA ligase [Stygiobacter sp.]